MTREDALNILQEYTKTEGLLKHAYAVEAAMRGYAKKYGEDEELWGVTGLLHDFDYERYPEYPDHPLNEELRGRILRGRFPSNQWLRDRIKKMRDLMAPIWMRSDMAS